MMKINRLILFISFLLVGGKLCAQEKVQLVTVDPGHFHAALVQKTMYKNVDPVVQVYAPAGADLQMHLARIEAYNNRPQQPTTWQEQVHEGNDFFEQMIREKKGNTVVLSGNNQKKAAYILACLQNGFNVLADKPMAIDASGFEQLKDAFAIAAKNRLLLYDIMTERYEITTMLQRQISMLPAIFGRLEKGTAENPAITKESVHHFYKYVSGNVLTRPAWFMDVTQQGEGIVDVMTHLVDLVQWECFPGKIIDTNNISINSARRWATNMSLANFTTITGIAKFPAYLSNDVSNDTLLKVFSNGEINYTINGVHAKTSVTWNYKAPGGTGDTHYSIMRGTKANLVIRQGAEQNYLPTLYIEPVAAGTAFDPAPAFKSIQSAYPGVSLQKTNKGWIVVIPDKYKEGHEAHFGRVMENFLSYYRSGKMPKWEVPNMIAKYYTTTKALQLAQKNN